MANVIQTFPKGTGSGGGHTILDTDGTAVAQEKNLQFTGLSVTDDSTNEITEVVGEGLNADSIDDIAGATSLVPAVVIGDANNYSTNEKIVGKWVDGKPIYQKTFNFGTLPNTNIKSVTHGILNLSKIISIQGFAFYNTSIIFISLPFSHPTTNYNISINIDETNINVITGSDRSGWSGYITLCYTKTTD